MGKPTPLSFLVPGFSKCGSTTLCTLLASHPGIFIPGIKETNFLMRPDYDQTWQKFDGMFSAANPNQILGDGSILYTSTNHEVEARTRIRKHYPNIKLIFIARDPINRIESSFREFHNSGPRYGLDTPYELMAAFKQLPGIIDDTLYWSRLNCYREAFPEHSIHLVFLEELKRDSDKVMKACFEFLGVDSSIPLPEPGTHDNPGSAKLRDTRLLRGMRNTPYFGQLLAKIPVRKQEAIFPLLGLRTPFKDTDIDWDKETVNWLLQQLGEEIDRYLNHAGRSSGLWHRFEQFKHSN
ncbi:sulfotransferase domain-containing protein [bacterium]|nr:sulfotransferase domain-containing protein [bacterium]